MKEFENLQPKDVLGFFKEICSIPHGSKNVDQISDYLVEFAKTRNLVYRQDEAKNVIIWKDGSKGHENAPSVILQGHIDMVAVKDHDCKKDLQTEGLDIYVDGDWLKAKGTSLGGDDGIAVAYALAVLNDDTLVHPPIEAVFTTDEEIGLLGAAALDTSDLKGKIFLNMDSEDEGVFTVSCAGGASTTCHLPITREVTSGTVLKLTLTGLTGGHSGVEIHKGRKNSNVAMGRLLNQIIKKAEAVLVEVNGGTKDNAIANETIATVIVPEKNVELATLLLNREFEYIKGEATVTDPGITFKVETAANKEVNAMTAESTKALNLLLNLLPYGVQRMNPEIPGMVQTSLNMGILSTTEEEVIMTYSVRSAKTSEKDNLIEKLNILATYAGGYTTTMGDYPGWDYKADSKLLQIMLEAYREQYNQEPIVEGIHAGLECGIFASKIEGLDAISFGPQMHNVHTTKEELSISSVKRTYELVKSTLEKLA